MKQTEYKQKALQILKEINKVSGFKEEILNDININSSNLYSFLSGDLNRLSINKIDNLLEYYKNYSKDILEKIENFKNSV